MGDEPPVRRDALAAVLAPSLREQAGLAAAYLYGSRARERATPLSDLDVAILFTDRRGDAADRRLLASEVAASLSRALEGSGLERARVDVRDVEELPLSVQGEILTHGVRLASNHEVRRVRFEAAVRQRYLDFLPYREATVGPALRALRKRHTRG